MANGKVKVAVTTGGGSLPLAGVRVELRNTQGRLLGSGLTDSSGIIIFNSLPAPPAALSLRQRTSPRAAARYDITVTHPQHGQRVYRGVPVYDGVQTIRKVFL